MLHHIIGREQPRFIELTEISGGACPAHHLIPTVVYFLIIWGPGLTLSIAGAIVSGANLAKHTAPALLWLAVITTYFLFWFAALFLIICFNRNSSFNAIAGIGSWLLFLIIVPSRSSSGN